MSRLKETILEIFNNLWLHSFLLGELLNLLNFFFISIFTGELIEQESDFVIDWSC